MLLIGNHIDISKYIAEQHKSSAWRTAVKVSQVSSPWIMEQDWIIAAPWSYHPSARRPTASGEMAPLLLEHLDGQPCVISHSSEIETHTPFCRNGHRMLEETLRADGMFLKSNYPLPCFHIAVDQRTAHVSCFVAALGAQSCPSLLKVSCLSVNREKRNPLQWVCDRRPNSLSQLKCH